MSRRVPALATALICCGLIAHVQPQRRVETGDASVSGIVTDRHSKQPIVGAIVELALWQLNGQLLTQTDSDGRFTFDGIAEGQYRIIARHAGYVTQGFGVTDPAPVALQLKEGVISIDRGQRRRDINFALVRGASVSGRITSADGLPLAGAMVRAVLRRVDGSFVFSEHTMARSNDRGEYFMSNLPEGQYDVAATWADPTLSRGAKAALGVTYQQTSTPIYQPATSRAQYAEPVKVTPGSVISNVDIRFPPTELVRIAGQVVRSGTDGEVEAVLLSDGSEHKLNVDRDGTFTTPRVRAGRYTLFARSRTDDASEATWLSVDLTFEMTDIVLALLPTGSIVGKVMTDTGSPIPDMLQIAAVLTDEGKDLDPNRRDRGYLEPDGTFDVRGLFGPRVLRAVGVTEGWAIDRVMLGKAEVTSFTVQPGSRVEDVVIVLKQRQ